MIETKKRCEQCHAEKELDLFHKSNSKTDGRMRICAQCYKDNLHETQRRQAELMQKWEQERIEREQQKQQERERQEQERQARNREASLAANRICPRCKAVRTDGRLWESGHLYFPRYCEACQEYTPHSIYTLTCPLFGMVRYVGITMQSLNKRLQGHVRGDSGTERKSDWIETLKQSSLKPIIALVSESPNEQQAKMTERRYILHYIQQGCPLVNVEAMDAQLVLDAQNSTINFLEASEEEIRDLFRHFSLDEIVERGRQHEYWLERYQKQRWLNRYKSVYIIYNASSQLSFIRTRLDTLKREWALRYDHVCTSDELPADRQERETILQDVTEVLFYTEGDKILSDLLEHDCKFLLERKIPIASQYYHIQEYHTEYGLLASIATTKKYPYGKVVIHPLSYTVSPEKSLICTHQH